MKLVACRDVGASVLVLLFPLLDDEFPEVLSAFWPFSSVDPCCQQILTSLGHLVLLLLRPDNWGVDLAVLSLAVFTEHLPSVSCIALTLTDRQSATRVERDTSFR